MGGRGLFTRFGVDRDQVPLFVPEASVGRQAARDRVVELPNYVYEEICRDAGPMTIYGQSLADQDHDIAAALDRARVRLAIGVRTESLMSGSTFRPASSTPA